MDLVVTEQLAKCYGARAALAGLDLRIPEGSLFGFLGPNGAGKSTTLRLLLGLLRPSAGRAWLCGFDAWREGRQARAEVGYLPGELRLPGWMSAASGLALVERVRKRALARAGLQLVERLRLDPRVPARQMSSGMRQKLGLVLALAHEPRLLVLDEPSSALDPLVQLELQAILRERSRAGTTIVFSSHSLAEVDGLCERVAILREGRLVAHESLATLRALAPRHVVLRFERARVGEPPAFLELETRTPTLWRGTLCGPVQELLRWAAAESIADLSLGEADLESLFHRHYRGESNSVSA
ncbi:MAG: ABC transporter ATP-binding protein [Planctomycetes bacterium]|nr:ABC transporter ATP-binding protein [Planctomycetota bacterium]